MLKLKVFVAALVTVVLLLVPGTALAKEHPPCVLVGTAYLDGEPVSQGTTVAAYVASKEEPVAESRTGSSDLPNSQFYLQIPGQYAGEEVSFTVGDVHAQETITWSEEGSTISRDLHASTTTQPSEGNSGGETTGSGIKSVKVENLEPGAKATAHFDPSTGVLTLGIPKGEPAVEDVIANTVEPGASATANFNPRTGVLTIDVPQGKQGPKGDTGTSVEQVKVKTLEPGSEATVEFNQDTGMLTLGVPKGEKGERGEQGPGAPGGAALPIIAIVLAAIALIVSFVFTRRPKV